ncbi:MAG TPA: hypothetical protein VKP01_11485 [Saliniramus sp.]|nr:hypothetical protein [Saliniramus sp.]
MLRKRLEGKYWKTGLADIFERFPQEAAQRLHSLRIKASVGVVENDLDPQKRYAVMIGFIGDAQVGDDRVPRLMPDDFVDRRSDRFGN